MTGSLEFVFFATYSVIPGNFFFKKFSLDIGPFINTIDLFFFIIFKPKSKQSSMYLFDLSEIFENALLNL